MLRRVYNSRNSPPAPSARKAATLAFSGAAIYMSQVMETENRSRRSALKAMLAGTAAGLLRAKESHHDVVRLDSDYQTIENFAASDCWSMQKLGTWSLPNRNRVADLLFSQTGGIGLSCWRFNLGGGITDKIN